MCGMVHAAAGYGGINPSRGRGGFTDRASLHLFQMTDPSRSPDAIHSSYFGNRRSLFQPRRTGPDGQSRLLCPPQLIKEQAAGFRARWSSCATIGTSKADHRLPIMSKIPSLSMGIPSLLSAATPSAGNRNRRSSAIREAVSERSSGSPVKRQGWPPAVLFLERLSPAIEQVDSSVGRYRTAVNAGDR